MCADGVPDHLADAPILLEGAPADRVALFGEKVRADAVEAAGRHRGQAAARSQAGAATIGRPRPVFRLASALRHFGGRR